MIAAAVSAVKERDYALGAAVGSDPRRKTEVILLRRREAEHF